MLRLNISICGMHCEHCVQAVGDALRRSPGVDHCDVRIGGVEILFDEGVTSKAELFAVIRGAGPFGITGFSAAD